MKIIELDQNTPEWLQWREQGIGASEAPTICNENPYETPFGLWQLRTGRRKKKAEKDQADGRPDPRAHGRAHEDIAREKLCQELGILLYPICMQHESISFMAASPDCFNEDEFVGGDIKCPDDLRNHALAQAGIVPHEYRAQLQHQIEVARVGDKWPRWFYYSYWKETDEGVLVWVEPDLEFIEHELLPAEEDFWGRVQKKEWPMPEGELRDDTVETIQLFKRWSEYKKLVEGAEVNERRYRSELMKKMGDLAKLRIGDVGTISRVFVQGNVEYTAIPGVKEAMRGKNWDDYRFPGNIQFRPRRLK